MNTTIFWILLSIISILTLLILYAAWQAFGILHEAKSILKKINKSLDGQLISSKEALKAVRRFFHRSGESLK